MLQRLTKPVAHGSTDEGSTCTSFAMQNHWYDMIRKTVKQWSMWNGV